MIMLLESGAECPLQLFVLTNTGNVPLSNIDVQAIDGECTALNIGSKTDP
jgi:hypothetical protein